MTIEGCRCNEENNGALEKKKGWRKFFQDTGASYGVLHSPVVVERKSVISGGRVLCLYGTVTRPPEQLGVNTTVELETAPEV